MAEIAAAERFLIREGGKAEVKAELSGIYIVGIKSVRGGMPVKEEPKKKGFFARFKKSK